MLTKTDYIIRQLARAEKKKYENYVVTRIWHLLDNQNVKIVTQQYVSRPEGRAMTDLYFPQLGIHIEVDEKQHFNSLGERVAHDNVREADIINATNHEILRVKVAEESIEAINRQVDEVLMRIREKIMSVQPIWDFDADFNPATYIAKGKIAVDENVAFRTVVDALCCFGRPPKSIQRGFVKHPKEDRMIWFPRLFLNKDWDNRLSCDEEEISERKLMGHDEFFKEKISDVKHQKERLVFAKVKSNLGDVMYRFKGVYKLDVPLSLERSESVYKRVAKEVKTYATST